VHTSYFVNSNKFLQLYSRVEKLPKCMSNWKKMLYFYENENPADVQLLYQALTEWNVSMCLCAHWDAMTVLSFVLQKQIQEPLSLLLVEDSEVELKWNTNKIGCTYIISMKGIHTWSTKKDDRIYASSSFWKERKKSKHCTCSRVSTNITWLTSKSRDHTLVLVGLVSCQQTQLPWQVLHVRVLERSKRKFTQSEETFAA
jgi:hypothetical protein